MGLSRFVNINMHVTDGGKLDGVWGKENLKIGNYFTLSNIKTNKEMIIW